MITSFNSSPTTPLVLPRTFRQPTLPSRPSWPPKRSPFTTRQVCQLLRHPSSTTPRASTNCYPRRPDLKNTSDDALANYLNSLGFRQSHFLEDVRLGLGYAALLVAAACFAWDYKLGWEATKLWTACAVGFYAALNGGLSLWVWLVEQGTVYQGTAKDGRQLYIATSAKKGDPTYRLKVAILDAGAGKEGADAKGFEFEAPFASFFNDAGFFVPEPFQRLLVKNISVVAAADPKRAAALTETKTADVKEEKSSASADTQALLDGNPELLDAVLQAEAQTTGAEKKKGGKRRKA